MFEIRHYRSTQGRTSFTEWFSGLRDRQARARIVARLERLETGNFGGCKGVGGGDKRKQDSDIKKSVELWQEFVDRKRSEPRAKR